MSGSPTFDTEKKNKKNKNGGILRLRLAYGRRSNYITMLHDPYDKLMHLLMASRKAIICSLSADHKTLTGS